MVSCEKSTFRDWRMTQTARKYGTVRKVGRVLDLYSLECPEWGVGEVARALGLPASSASELLSVLEDEGFLRRTRAGRYRLGWRVMSLNRILVGTTELRDEAHRAMEHLVSLFGETVHFAALERGQVIYLDKLQGTRAVRVEATGVGVRIHGHCSGVGKVLLAHLPWEEAVGILEREGMPARTPNTITTPEGFQEELELVRKQGYAYDLEEGVLELCCVAAPVRDLSGEVVAAMSLSVPAYRFEGSKDTYQTTLLATTRELSERLGYPGTGRLRKRSSKRVPSKV